MNYHSSEPAGIIARFGYFILAFFLLLVEILIAVYVHDRIIRPYIGDFLVVIMVYCFVRAVVKIPMMKAAAGVLLFAFLIEFLQYLDLIRFLGLQNSRLANVVLGNYFEWIDMVAYTSGIVFVIIVEIVRSDRTKKRYSA